MSINKHNLLKYIILLLAIITVSGGVLQPVFAFTMAEAREVQKKTKVSQEKLRAALEDGKDVSEIIPMMKQVKVLGDAKKISQANALLDNILLKFEQLIII